MIPDRDYYADKEGKLTTDPTQYARQIGVKGHFLEERVAKRYGIMDTLVSTDEPGAVRSVKGRPEIIEKASPEDESEELEETQEPQEPAVAAETEAEEQEAEKPKAEPAKPAAKKGEKHQ